MATNYETLTDSLLIETKDALKIEFDERVKAAAFDAKDNPLGLEDAKVILHELLRIALDRRSRLDGRIADSVKNGSLYKDYYGDIENMNELNIELTSAKSRRKSAKKDLAYSKAVESVARGQDARFEIDVDALSDDEDNEQPWGGIFKNE